jgi:ribosomal protein S20
MPNRKNALLQIRKDTRRRERNTAAKARLKTERKNFEKILAAGARDDAQSAYRNLVSVIDKTVKKGVIPFNRGSRLKSRYGLKVNALN